jgi:hypothetical protein
MAARSSTKKIFAAGKSMTAAGCIPEFSPLHDRNSITLGSEPSFLTEFEHGLGDHTAGDANRFCKAHMRHVKGVRTHTLLHQQKLACQALPCRMELVANS